MIFDEKTTTVNITGAARLLGVNAATIQWWWRSRALRGTHSPSGFWDFKTSDLESFARAKGLDFDAEFTPGGRYLSVPKLAAFLDLTVKQVRLDIERGQIVTANLPSGRTGRRTLWVSRKEAERLREQLRQSPKPRARKRSKVPT